MFSTQNLNKMLFKRIGNSEYCYLKKTETKSEKSKKVFINVISPLFLGWPQFGYCLEKSLVILWQHAFICISYRFMADKYGENHNPSSTVAIIHCVKRSDIKCFCYSPLSHFVWNWQQQQQQSHDFLGVKSVQPPWHIQLPQVHLKF